MHGMSAATILIERNLEVGQNKLRRLGQSPGAKQDDELFGHDLPRGGNDGVNVGAGRQFRRGQIRTISAANKSRGPGIRNQIF
jgi:hypothetical protein